MVDTLPPLVIEGHAPTTVGNEDHPMRVMTRRIAGLAAGAWDTEATKAVTDVFNHLAPEWHTRTTPQRTQVVADAIERGLVPLQTGREMAVEVGSGIGTYSSLLALIFEQVISVEIAWEMVSRAGDESHRIQGDGNLLPVGDVTADSMVMINAFLFPGEVSRVLRVGGVVLWVNTSGEDTPIHLSSEDVVEAIPFDVEGVESRAGVGTWCALRRI